MDPVHTEVYKGCEIKIFAWEDAHNGGYVGMYEIGPSPSRGVVKGGLVISVEAEKVALEQAKSWIDRHG